MRIADWARLWAGDSRIRLGAPDAKRNLRLSGVVEEARPFLCAAEYLGHPKKIFVVTSSHEKCLKWKAKLAICGVPASDIYLLPEGASGIFEDAPPEVVAISDRIGALEALMRPEPCIILASPQAALERTLPRELLEEVFVEIRPGESTEPRKLLRKLLRLGYEYAEPVRLPGQISHRGGILDVWATGLDAPARIEFFGDEIESIRSFDASTQRSSGAIPALRVAPSRETLFPEESAAFVAMLESALHAEAAHLTDEAAANLEQLVKSDIQNLESRTYFDRLDLYRPLLHPDSGCAIDLLDEGALVVLEEPAEIWRLATRTEEELAQALDSRANRGELLRSHVIDFMLAPDHFAHLDHTVALGLLDWSTDELSHWEHEAWETANFEGVKGQPEMLTQGIRSLMSQSHFVAFSTDQPVRAKTVLQNVELFFQDPPPTLSEETLTPGLYSASGNLGGGFTLPALKFAVVSDAELFGVARLKLPQKRHMEGAPIATVLDLKQGDYLVHIQFGIGIYQGMVRREVEGVEKEFLYIEYAHPDKLFVPTDQLDRIQKYLNPGDSVPKVNRLVGNDWQKTMAKAKEDAKAMAQDLVKLYAQRKMVERRPFGPDSPWQAEMESTFPWVETPSQAIAIREVKRDLESPYPMDRLVCGDVGFGKTEVAIRAAFKVVQEGRQVAVLCPTTILSEQHYRNFTERLGSFGVRVALINRFRTDSERKDALAKLRNGEVDILLGTHALLSKEIVFKDLGFVIIDEEQKFGVKQKEVLKNLRVEVDVLSLSATPIPRTLSMALMDLRQMSLINDPPPGRLPVRTYVRPFAKEVVREAALRELNRGGQVFYVYNRVQGIQHIAETIRKLVPSARVGIGHGQMSEQELEPVMLGFIAGEIDILVSTSIIENGIDISNANTLIVDNADRFGLSQLYQLKGRVGRSDRQAYAYFLHDNRGSMSEGALQRLQALQEFHNLGAGYSLAFRDLQIRGAGDLLGAKQSGSMASVGYELYSQLIQEQIEMLKNAVDGVPVELMTDDQLRGPEAPLPIFNLPTTAFIPDHYIQDHAQRLYFYQQMMRVRTEDALNEVRASIEDRYGHSPPEVAAAFHVLFCRIRGFGVGIDKVDAASGRFAVSLSASTKLSPLAKSHLSRMNREAYFNRDQLIWPYSGDALDACDRMIAALETAVAQAEEARRHLAET